MEETIHCLIPHGYSYKRVHLRAVVHQQSEGHVDERVLCDKVAEVSRFNTAKAWDAQIFLKDYSTCMKEAQNDICSITARASP